MRRRKQAQEHAHFLLGAVESKATVSEGGQEERYEQNRLMGQETESTVPIRAKQDSATLEWVETSVWTERMLATLDRGVKGGKWFSLIDKVYKPKTLWRAWQQVKSKRGASGIDRMSIERFERKAEAYLDELSTSLREQQYQVSAVRRVYIPKGKGRRRPLGIPTIKDRIVQTALRKVIEPIFEHEFCDESYGFRPGRGCKDALRAVDGWLKAGYCHVVDADIASYFDSIPHRALMEHVEARISDGRLLKLLEEYLQQSVMDGLEQWVPTAGTPQGAVLSPLLANIYLHPLDQLLSGRDEVKLVRYADDFVVLCRTQAGAESVLTEVRDWMTQNELTLHPEKTHIGDCREAGQGFEFLGYRFESGKRLIRHKSKMALRDRVRRLTKRNRGGSLEQVVAELNPVLRGWFHYFKHAHHREFMPLDRFIRRRLRAMLLRRNKRKGFGTNLYAHMTWKIAYFSELGLFTLMDARMSLCQS